MGRFDPLIAICAIVGTFTLGFYCGNTTHDEFIKNEWKSVRESVLGAEYEPNYLDEGKVFRVNGQLYARVRDEVYLMKVWK